MVDEELFASCYADECVGKIFINVLRKNGFIVRTSSEFELVGSNDEVQLAAAMELKSVLITLDKSTFLENSKANIKTHFGILIVTRQLSAINSAYLAKEAINKFLNRYTKDEWEGFVVNL